MPDAVSHKLTEFSVGKCDIANTELQRHGEVHQPDDERHRHEEDHDGAVRRENLVEMLGRQIALRTAGGHGLLRAHHDRVGEASQHHDQCQHTIHHADALVIDRRDPFAPQIRPISLQCDPRKNADDGEDHPSRRTHDDRLMKRDRAQLSLPRRFIVLPSVRPVDRAKRIVRGHPDVQDAAEQTRCDGAIGEWRDNPARLGQRRISHCVELRATVASCGDPLCKLLGSHHFDGKAHIRKTRATIIGGEPGVGSGVVSPQPKVRRHSRHGVDLAA